MKLTYVLCADQRIVGGSCAVQRFRCTLVRSGAVVNPVTLHLRFEALHKFVVPFLVTFKQGMIGEFRFENLLPPFEILKPN